MLLGKAVASRVGNRRVSLASATPASYLTVDRVGYPRYSRSSGARRWAAAEVDPEPPSPKPIRCECKQTAAACAENNRVRPHMQVVTRQCGNATQGFLTSFVTG